MAEEIVAGMAQYYADKHYEGRQHSFTVDLAFLESFDDPKSIHTPTLNAALDNVAKQLPSERVAWSFRFMPLAKVEHGSDTDYFLHAEVIDLYASHCCVIVGAELAQDERVVSGARRFGARSHLRVRPSTGQIVGVMIEIDPGAPNATKTAIREGMHASGRYNEETVHAMEDSGDILRCAENYYPL